MIFPFQNILLDRKCWSNGLNMFCIEPKVCAATVHTCVGQGRGTEREGERSEVRWHRDNRWHTSCGLAVDMRGTCRNGTNKKGAKKPQTSSSFSLFRRTGGETGNHRVTGWALRTQTDSLAHKNTELEFRSRFLLAAQSCTVTTSFGYESDSIDSFRYL